MANEVSGKNGGVYSSTLLIEDCEDEWTNDNATSCAADATDKKVGTASVKVVIPGALGANILLAHEGGIGLATLVGYDMVYLWIKSSIIAALNDNQLLLDDTAACDSPIETLHLPALAANTWTQVALMLADPSLLTAIDAVGLKQIAALGARNVWLDDIRALAEEDGIKSWTITYETDALDLTSFVHAGVSSFLPGISRWSGSFEGYKTGVPLGIGSEVYLVLGETSTGSRCWIGKAIITNAVPTTDHNGVVSYSYSFQGTGALEEPST